MPELKAADGKDYPKAAVASAEEVFDSRFAKADGKYYTVRVSCATDQSAVMAALSGVLSFDKGSDPLAFAKTMSGDLPQRAPLLVSMELIALEDLRTEVTSEDLTKADYLNNITWRGTFNVKAGAERRRTLDLATIYRQLLAAKDSETAVTIPWTSPHLGWKLSQEQSASLAKVEESTKGSSNNDASGIAGFLAEEFFKPYAEKLKPTGWGDWWVPKDSSFQFTTVTIRDGKASHTTTEAIEQVAPGKELGVITELFQIPDGGEQVFLLKPDLEALEDADLLK